jgi:hypothetical protein
VIDVVACDNFFAHRHLSLNLVPFVSEFLDCILPLREERLEQASSAKGLLAQPVVQERVCVL